MTPVMKTITEISRLPAPAQLPQALAFDGEQLWLGSIDTCRIYAMDPAHWTVRDEASVPGKPWGMTALGDELRVLCGEPPDDTRIIHQFVPGHGVRTSAAIPCPDDSGSHLSYDGKHLVLSQWYNKRLLELDASGKPLRAIGAPHQICGQVFVNGAYYLLTTDEEERGDYWITRLDPATGTAEDLAVVPFHARALAYDGTRFWTNHREKHETVRFALPE